ncbi:hypothetical protein [Sphingomonas sp.]|jgi:hypothetical protein|uniref:hypothetical protein n=1 Tax=Sphingomonas sp. TaxID=28214 RepID=UPI002D80F05D|nr:hypothetical protein [Sphingomonas sp.]HEU0044299.1 hypothetical protein [Sphingomonas sp.]
MKSQALRTSPLLILSAAMLLSACGPSPSERAANAADAANEAVAANVTSTELPPAIKADKTFRCKDNSLAFVTFFEGDMQAVVKDKADGTPVLLKAPAAGEPLTAEGGWSMTGDSEAGVTLTRPGKAAMSCRA